MTSTAITENEIWPVELAAIYASFAVTLLMRPFGSALFGSYTGRYGRRGEAV